MGDDRANQEGRAENGDAVVPELQGKRKWRVLGPTCSSYVRHHLPTERHLVTRAPEPQVDRRRRSSHRRCAAVPIDANKDDTGTDNDAPFCEIALSGLCGAMTGRGTLAAKIFGTATWADSLLQNRPRHNPEPPRGSYTDSTRTPCLSSRPSIACVPGASRSWAPEPSLSAEIGRAHV